jgi:leucyl-tRNA synthetase
MKLSNTMGAVTNNDDAAKLIDANPNLLSPTFEDSLRTLLLLLAPMAPHFSSEAWEILHSSAQEGSVDLQRGPEAPLSEQLWPVFKEEHLKEDIVNITVQINGKTRGLVALDIAFIEDEKTVCDLIAADTIGQKFLDGKSIKKTIYVKSRRFINFLID